jgi:hypothetical protein
MQQPSNNRKTLHTHRVWQDMSAVTMTAVGVAASVVLAWGLAPQTLAASTGRSRSVKSQVGMLASAIGIKETAKLLPAGSVGVKIDEKGSASGTIDGTASSNLTIAGNNIGGTFVLTTRSGTITGRTRATVVGQAAVPIVHFSGSLSIVGGSGRYAHASGRLSIKGTIRRKNYELAEEVSGTLRY